MTLLFEIGRPSTRKICEMSRAVIGISIAIILGGFPKVTGVQTFHKKAIILVVVVWRTHRNTVIDLAVVF